MLRLSPGVTLAWQMAAAEASHGKHEYIEPEHIFMGLCKAGDLLREDYLEDLGVPEEDIDNLFDQLGADAKELQDEIGIMNRLFFDFDLDQTDLRRETRSFLGRGEHDSERRVFHRSARCKKMFAEANKIAEMQDASTVEVTHLLYAMLESSSTEIDDLFEEHEVEIKEFLAELNREIKGEAGGRQGAGGRNMGTSAAKEKKKSRSDGDAKAKRKSAGSKASILEKYGRDVTREAREGNLAPMIGRRDELLKLVRTLSRKTKNNPVLVGEAGVGKTAIVEGLAQRIASGNITPHLRDKRIIEISMGSLVAGTKYRGEFESRLTKIIDEAKKNPDVILFIDEIHTVVSAGSVGEGALDAANILKPALARGDIRCIGATTTAEYAKYIENDPALERRFQPVKVKESSQESTRQILEGLKERYETHHGVSIEPSAIQAAVEFSVRYLTDRLLPDKAIDLLDEACTRAMVTDLSFHEKYEDDAKAAAVTDETVARVVEEWKGIPVQKIISETEQNRLMRMAEIIKKRIVGQDQAVETVVENIRMARAGMKEPGRPVGVFLFLGPTGAGKTELAKALALFLFNDESQLIRLDMSEYGDRSSVTRLIGASPGYIGYDKEGQLTGKLRANPYSIVLFDDVERAHPDVLDIFIQLFDEGRITDTKGRTVDATNAIFIMTSNSGQANKKQPLGFQSDDSTGSSKSIAGLGFPPDLLARIDEIIHFNSLKEEDIGKIVGMRIAELKQRLMDSQDITLEIDASALKLIVEKSFDGKSGGRNVRRSVERLLSKPLSEAIVTGRFKSGAKIHVCADTDGKKLLFSNQDQHITEQAADVEEHEVETESAVTETAADAHGEVTGKKTEPLEQDDASTRETEIVDQDDASTEETQLLEQDDSEALTRTNQTRVDTKIANTRVDKKGEDTAGSGTSKTKEDNILAEDEEDEEEPEPETEIIVDLTDTQKERDRNKKPGGEQ